MTDQPVPIRRALLSVSDKTGLIDLGKALVAMGVELLSTGGTAKALRSAGLPVKDVADITQFPEMMDGRVKTLHPMVHGGLLALRDKTDHQSALKEHGIPLIDLLVVNLYPFEATVTANGSYEDCVENIDIGGPAMIRAAAKNHDFVTVVVDVEDYTCLQDELNLHSGATTLSFRRKMAQVAYARTAAYDAAVSNWMAKAIDLNDPPKRKVMAGAYVDTLRYGENPHQSAWFYKSDDTRKGIATARQLQGKSLSYNNINDTDAAFELIAEFDPSDGPACAIIKHANPCGVACGMTLTEAYRGAFDCDRTSAFGGIIALNQTLDEETAEQILETFTEVVIAPFVSTAAKKAFARKPNLRLLETGGLPDRHAGGEIWKQVAGGYLIQDHDTGAIKADDLKVMTKRQPTDAELQDMLFAWKVVKHVKSNAIVYAKNHATVGIGAGQMSRVDSVRIAARKAQDMAETLGVSTLPIQGSVVASDAFFPFADGVLAAVAAGATAIIQPGGSMRDEDVIEAADQAELTMIFTSMRHFRH